MHEKINLYEKASQFIVWQNENIIELNPFKYNVVFGWAEIN